MASGRGLSAEGSAYMPTLKELNQFPDFKRKYKIDDKLEVKIQHDHAWYLRIIFDLI